MLLGDGLMGQVMEPVVFPDPIDLDALPKKDYILDGAKGRAPRKIFSMYLGQQGELLDHNWKLQAKYAEIEANEQRWENYLTDDADIVVVAYGSASRIAKSAIHELREKGHKIGLFRPITLWPYPTKHLRALTDKTKKIAVFELCAGQMVEDVMLAVGERAEIYFHGVPGGVIPTPAEAVDFLTSVATGDGKVGRRIEL